MKRVYVLFVLVSVFVSVLMIGCSGDAVRTEAYKTPKAPDADNTARNERDRSGATLTPGDQSETEADREITAGIRKGIMADDSLSFTAQNIKIITINGDVTLRGPVKNAAEKQAIEAKAKQVAGVKTVHNQLEIESNR